LFASGSVFGALACWILVTLTTSALPRSEAVVDGPVPGSSTSAPVAPEVSDATPAARSVTVPDAPTVVEKARQVPALSARRQEVRQVPVASLRTPSRNGSFVGSLRIDSTPSGARVFIDRQPAGVTPLTVPDLRAGSHAVRVEADGHMPWSSAIRVIADRQTFVHSPLTPLAIAPAPR
jgi:hypothetical protein